jgi:hypothetical protein
MYPLDIYISTKPILIVLSSRKSWTGDIHKRFLISAYNNMVEDYITLLRINVKRVKKKLSFYSRIPFHEFLIKDCYIVCLLYDTKRGECSQNGTAGLDIHIPRFSPSLFPTEFLFPNFLQQSLTAGQVINTDRVKTFCCKALLLTYTFSGSLLFRKDCTLYKKGTCGITPV